MILLQSEACRIAMCENPQWSVVMLLFGMISCSVPHQMKAELILTLAALARTPEIAATLWQTLEASQVNKKLLVFLLHHVQTMFSDVLYDLYTSTCFQFLSDFYQHCCFDVGFFANVYMQ